MTLALAAVLGYVVLQLGLGVLVSRRIRTEDDYLLAGRRLGPGLATFSIFATWFGAETCIGAAGAVYREGLSATRADPFGYALCIAIVAGVFAVPLWKARITTLGDLFRQRYSPGVERFAVLLMIPTSVLWAAAQIRAFGQVLASSSDAVSVTAGMGFAAIAVLAYTAVGGLLADAWTDLVQGVVLVVGLVALSVAVVGDLGGLSAAVAAVDSAHWAWSAPGETPLAVLNRWAIPVLGSLMAQELVARIVACRSPDVARRSAWLASGGYLFVGLMPIGLGLAATGLALSLDDAEQVLPALAAMHLPAIGYVLFVGAMVSAILSTVDSCLLVSGSLISHNLVVPRMPAITERGRLLAARLGVIGSGLAAWWLAFASDSVLGLVEEASGFGSAGILVLAVFALWSPFGGVRAATAALGAGVTVWIAAHFVYALSWDYLASIAAAFAAYGVVGALERRGRLGLEPIIEP
ncbi:MAG TPA: sodium:solute symporter [Methylomirabilota bacterium]